MLAQGKQVEGARSNPPQIRLGELLPRLLVGGHGLLLGGTFS